MRMSNTVSNSEPFIPRLILTAGEPAGIGPDLIIDIAQKPFNAELVVAADPELLEQRAELLGLPLHIHEHKPTKTGTTHKPGNIGVIPVTAPAAVSPGVLNITNATFVLDSITTATKACLQNQFDAMITPPVNKAVINKSGHPFIGHTEFIAELCAKKQPVMMLMNRSLRVALATTHLPLAKVPASITGEHIEQVIKIVHQDLREKFGIDEPKLLVCGVNPHAGEDGYLGEEESKVITPVIEKLKAQGLDLSGPAAADTAFTTGALDGVDAVITMYHDQGLPVLKSQGFGEIVNITLGLPVIRTSVDHGTALDLAGTGSASSSSLVAAIDTAIELVLKRKNSLGFNS